MHIAFVTPESPYGDESVCGVAAYLRAIVPAIAEAGHAVTVIANAKEEKSFHAENDRVFVRHFRLPSWHWYSAQLPLIRNVAPLPLRQIEWSRAFYREAARLGATRRIDVIESTEAGSLFLNRVAPVVIRLHGSQRIFSEKCGQRLNASVKANDRLEARACERAAAITAPSEFHAQEIARRRGWAADRVHVIPNLVSSNLLNAASQFERNGSGERLVLYTGRLAPIKGIETLLEAAKLVRAADPSITFVLAGPWQMPKGPTAYGLALNDASNGICWIGPRPATEIAQLYQRATLFVMPSYYESFSISAAEAIAFGVPVVAANAGALPEIVSHEKTGWLVPSANAPELASGLLRLFSDKELRARLSCAGRDHLNKNFSLGRIVDKTLSVYASAMAERQSCVS